MTSLVDPGDGRCDAAECTLREAIAAAQPGETITFDPALFATGPGKILLTSGALVLDKALTIQGPGQKRLQIDGQQLSRVFTITATGVVTLSRLTIQGGRCHQCNGGGIANVGTLTLVSSTLAKNTARFGGGISNDFGGRATIFMSALRANRASFGGGGLYNRHGMVRLSRSTVSGNKVGFRNTGTGSGGGLRNDEDGKLEILSSTVSNNTATVGGGGIKNLRGGTLRLTASTVSGNTASFRGGGIDNNVGGTVRFAKSIIAGNTVNGTASDCLEFTAFQSLGFNLTGMGTGCASDPTQGDLTIDPARVFTEVLGPLQDNGGLTATHALLPGSPALDVIDADMCPATDQRGVARPQGSRCDIGAFELEVP